MSNFIPKIPIELQIRKIVFEKFNDVNSKFSNDDLKIISQCKLDNFNPKSFIDDHAILQQEILDKG